MKNNKNNSKCIIYHIYDNHKMQIKGFMYCIEKNHNALSHGLLMCIFRLKRCNNFNYTRIKQINMPKMLTET